MKNQTKRRGVEADGATIAHRSQCEAAGEEFEKLLREQLTHLAGQCDQTPYPRQDFYDAAPTRSRPLSMRKVGAMLASVARTPSLPSDALAAFGAHFSAWLLSLVPTRADSLMLTWESETKAQADADIAQARALAAIARQDVPAIEAAIDETAQHLAAMQRLLVHLTTARRDAVLSRRQSMHLARA